MLQIFQYFVSSPLTFHEGQRNWHALKGFAIDYYFARFQDCSDNSVWENLNVSIAQDFSSAFMTVNLDEGLRNWYGTKGQAT